MPWEGTASDILASVQAELDANKDTIGVTQVTTGERKRGWTGSTMEVFLDTSGVTVDEGGRHGANRVRVPVLVQARSRHASKSEDAEVLGMIERTADVLKGDPTAGGHAKKNKVRGYRVLSLGRGDQGDGKYETIGLLRVDYWTTHQDR